MVLMSGPYVKAGTLGLGLRLKTHILVLFHTNLKVYLGSTTCSISLNKGYWLKLRLKAGTTNTKTIAIKSDRRPNISKFSQLYNHGP